MNKFDQRASEWWHLHKNGGGSMNWRQIAERDGVTRDTVKNQALRWAEANGKREGAPPSEVPSSMPEIPVTIAGEVKGDIIFEDRKSPPTDEDVQALLDAYLVLQKKAKAMSTRQDKATVKLGDGLPVGIVFFGDSHIGAWGWAAERQLADIQLLIDTDGLFGALMGDEWDNFIFNFGKWASMMTPAHQRKVAHYLFKRMMPKTVACVGGNHTHWTKKVADIDLNAELAEAMKAVFLGHRGDLYVKVGAQEYHMFLHHKSRGASTVNKTNSARVTANDIGGADVIVEADRHEPWSQVTYQNRRRQVWLRTGTFKVDDDYTAEIDFEQGKTDMPMVVMFPDTHKVVEFLSFHDGLTYLKAVREQYRAKGA